jgi:stress-induced morphogen
MSGNTAEDVQKVDPQFIKVAGIEQSLTPGRNNGFLNMLKVMKRKASELDAAARESGEGAAASTDKAAEATATEIPATIVNDSSQGPKYNAMVNALQTLKPTSLTLIDNSHQHAGHAGNDMDGESHYEVEIVSAAFEGLNLVKRHRLVYMVLGDMMQQIHALQIRALTPEEAEKSSSGD